LSLENRVFLQNLTDSIQRVEPLNFDTTDVPDVPIQQLEKNGPGIFIIVNNESKKAFFGDTDSLAWELMNLVFDVLEFNDNTEPFYPEFYPDYRKKGRDGFKSKVLFPCLSQN
jgi:hypothetical protein